MQGELFRAHAHIRPRRANFFAHKARQDGGIETTNTTAHPQQGSLETGIASAPEKRAKNAHFAPAKAMAVSIEARQAPAKATGVSIEARQAPAKATGVSIPHEHERAKATTVSAEARPTPAKATTVSDDRPSWPTGPDCGAHGQRRHHRHPNVARNLSRSFFETPQKHCNSNDTNSMLEQASGELRAKLMGRRGLAGLRGDAPSRRLAARTARGRAAAHRLTKQPGPTGVEGAGGTGGHGRASRRGAERSEALASRAAGPSGARNTSGATSNIITRADRRPRRSPAPLGARNTRGATSNTRKQERRHHRHNQGKQKPQIPKDLRFHRARGGS